MRMFPDTIRSYVLWLNRWINLLMKSWYRGYWEVFENTQYDLISEVDHWQCLWAGSLDTVSSCSSFLCFLSDIRWTASSKYSHYQDLLLCPEMQCKNEYNVIASSQQCTIAIIFNYSIIISQDCLKFTLLLPPLMVTSMEHRAWWI